MTQVNANERQLIEYKIVKLPHQSIAGDDLWTVVQYVDGVCKGGDHHWVRQRFAERAHLLYEKGHAIHGQSTSIKLGLIYRGIFGESMFDKDPT